MTSSLTSYISFPFFPFSLSFLFSLSFPFSHVFFSPWTPSLLKSYPSLGSSSTWQPHVPLLPHFDPSPSPPNPPVCPSLDLSFAGSLPILKPKGRWLFSQCPLANVSAP